MFHLHSKQVWDYTYIEQGLVFIVCDLTFIFSGHFRSEAQDTYLIIIVNSDAVLVSVTVTVVENKAVPLIQWKCLDNLLPLFNGIIRGSRLLNILIKEQNKSS